MHPTTSNMLASASQDRTVVVWDSRRSQTASMVINTGSPALALDWHLRKDYVFAVGLEDGAVATFDTRAPKHSLNRLVRSQVRCKRPIWSFHLFLRSQSITHGIG